MVQVQLSMAGVQKQRQGHWMRDAENCDSRTNRLPRLVHSCKAPNLAFGRAKHLGPSALIEEVFSEGIRAKQTEEKDKSRPHLLEM